MKIEKAIDMPSRGRGRPNKYPFPEMNVGDSLFFEGETSTLKCRPYIAAQLWGRLNNAKFSGRTVDGGVRIWRVK